MSDPGPGDARRPTLDTIKITGIEVFGHHGVLAEEKRTGQRFLVDVEMRLDLSAAGNGDDLAATVDYGVVARRIHEVVATEQWDLIERVATRVAETVLEDGRIEAVVVTVHKPQAPIPVEFGDVTVTLRRDRD